jgi:hypothetical protein
MNKQKQLIAAGQRSPNEFNRIFLKKFNRELRLLKDIRNLLIQIDNNMPTINIISHGVREGLTAAAEGSEDAQIVGGNI